MAETIELSAPDGHRFSAYQAQPSGTPRGALVIIQEIFGITQHMREVADQYAALGYTSIVPAMFDRVRPGIVLDYSQMQEGVETMMQLKPSQTLLDVGAAVDAAAASVKKTGLIGYCWGGTMAYVAACRLPISAAVSYYGGRILQYADRKPRCPVMYHFGEKDQSIPMATVEKVRELHPEGIFYIYPAGHGFNCNARASYEPESARLAFERSLEFLRTNVG
jgi:carboxymethylenebutenolidase